jgi:hypothetical protein
MAEWREVEGWPGYEVSDAGEVRSWKVTRRDPHAALPRVLAGHRGPNGYRTVSLKDRGRKQSAYIHHLVAFAFHGPRPEGSEVAHWDGDKINNSVANLRYATPKENGADTVRLSASQRGERHYSTDLTNEQAAAVKSFAGSHSEAAAAFGIPYHRAYSIRMGLSWRWLGAA